MSLFSQRHCLLVTCRQPLPIIATGQKVGLLTGNSSQQTNFLEVLEISFTRFALIFSFSQRFLLISTYETLSIVKEDNFSCCKTPSRSIQYLSILGMARIMLLSGNGHLLRLCMQNDKVLYLTRIYAQIIDKMFRSCSPLVSATKKDVGSVVAWILIE